MKKEHRIAFAVMVAALLLAPLVVYPVFLMKVMCFALFASAFNLLVGYGGLLSFGHAMFLGTAGYASAHAAKVWGFPPEAAILFGTLCSAALGVVSGLLAIRRQGIYFAMITLALAQMIFFFYLQAPFTGGEDGIQAVPRGRLLGFVDLSNIWAMYATVLTREMDAVLYANGGTASNADLAQLYGFHRALGTYHALLEPPPSINPTPSAAADQLQKAINAAELLSKKRVAEGKPPFEIDPVVLRLLARSKANHSAAARD